MDKETFSSYGWIVITVIVIAIMISFATPFGKFIVDAVTDVLKDFQGNVDTAISDLVINTDVSMIN